MRGLRAAWRPAAAGLVVGLAAVWLASLVAAPYALARHAHDRRAAPLWVVTTYLAGAALCHQRPERSFHPWGTQMPVCARCFGIYAGAGWGALLACALPRGAGDFSRQTRRWRRAIGASALPTAVLVAAEAGHVVEPSSVVRAVGAVPLGLVVAALVVAALARSSRGPTPAH